MKKSKPRVMKRAPVVKKLHREERKVGHLRREVRAVAGHASGSKLLDADRDDFALHGKQYLGEVRIAEGVTTIDAGSVIVEIPLDPKSLAPSRLSDFAKLFQMIEGMRSGYTYKIKFTSSSTTFLSGEYAAFLLFGGDSDAFRSLTNHERRQAASTASGFKVAKISKDLHVTVEWPKGLTAQYTNPGDDLGLGFSRWVTLVVIAYTDLHRPEAVPVTEEFTFATCDLDYRVLLSKPDSVSHTAGAFRTIRGSSPVADIAGTPTRLLTDPSVALDMEATTDGPSGVVTGTLATRSRRTMRRMTDAWLLLSLQEKVRTLHIDEVATRSVLKLAGYRASFNGFLGTIAELLVPMIPGGALIEGAVNGIGKLIQAVKPKAKDAPTLVRQQNKLFSAFSPSSPTIPAPAQPNAWFSTIPGVGRSTQRFGNFGPVTTDSTAVTSDNGVVYGTTGVTVLQSDRKDPEVPTGYSISNGLYAGSTPYVPSTFADTELQFETTRTVADPAATHDVASFPRSNPETVVHIPPGGAFAPNPWMKPGVVSAEADVMYNKTETAAGGFDGRSMDGPLSGIGSYDISGQAYKNQNGSADKVPGYSVALEIKPKHARHLRLVSREDVLLWYNYPTVEDHPHYAEMDATELERWVVMRDRLQAYYRGDFPVLSMAALRLMCRHFVHPELRIEDPAHRFYFGRRSLKPTEVPRSPTKAKTSREFMHLDVASKGYAPPVGRSRLPALPVKKPAISGVL